MYTKYNLAVKKNPRQALSLKNNLTADAVGSIYGVEIHAGIKRTARTNIFNDFTEDGQPSPMYQENPFGPRRLKTRTQ